MEVLQQALIQRTILALKARDRFVCEDLDFAPHSRCESRISVLHKLALWKLLAVSSPRKHSKQKRELWQLKKTVLSYTTVFVHWLSHDREVDWRSLEVAVIFLVAVAKHQHLKHLDVPRAQICIRQRLKQTRLRNRGVLRYVFADWLLFAFRATLIEKRLESCFEVQSHSAETSALEVEVKFHVFFRGYFLRFSFVGLFGSRLANSLAQFGRPFRWRRNLKLCHVVLRDLSRFRAVFHLRWRLWKKLSSSLGIFDDFRLLEGSGGRLRGCRFIRHVVLDAEVVFCWLDQSRGGILVQW